MTEAKTIREQLIETEQNLHGPAKTVHEQFVETEQKLHGPLTAAQIALHARDEVASITGLEADHVSAVGKDDCNWCVTVDLVELKRIPAATDVLGAYDVVLDEFGQLISYHRNRRYFRDELLKEQS